MNRETLMRKTLVVAIEEGLNEKGNPIIKRYTYSNIKNAATPEDLRTAADALAELHKGIPHEYNTVSTSMLV